MTIRLFECSTVIAVDVEEIKLSMAYDFGVTHVVNSKKQDPVETIYNITNGIGVDYSVESAGSTLTIEQAFKSVRNKGRVCVFASHPEHNQEIKLDP